jgi:hypothetical protein
VWIIAWPPKYVGNSMPSSERIGGIIEIHLSTIGKNLRQCQRTSTEERSARQKHQAVLGELNGHYLNGAG